MTKVTTITEYFSEEGKRVEISNDLGFSASLVYKEDESTITMNYPDGEAHVWCEHPDDAFSQLLAQFFEF